MKVAPGVITIVGVRRIERRGRHRRCGVRRPAGPRKRTETVIHNKPIGKLELFIIINKKCQSHLMRRRRWFIDMSSTGISSAANQNYRFISMFSSEISSAARLPRLSSPAMKDDWIYEREKENRYRVLADGGEQRNS